MKESIKFILRDNHPEKVQKQIEKHNLNYYPIRKLNIKYRKNKKLNS